MNSDQIKGTAKEVAGKVQSKTGEIIGSPDQQAKGMARQAEGKTEKTVGDVKKAMKDSTDKR